jgi:HEAT repeat protein
VTAVRRAVRASLERGEFDAVQALAGRDRSLVRTLVSLLYDPEELLRWRAVGMIGRVAAAHPELARPLVRRLLWTLNDESGGIGWTSAPALGEIGRNAPALLRDCVRVVVNYLEDPTLLPGVVWAIGRLARAYPGEVREVVPQLIGHLGAAAPGLRAQVAWTLGEIGDGRAAAALGGLAADREPARLYVEDELVTREVRVWAEEALAKL